MSYDEDSKPSAIEHLDTHNTNNNQDNTNDNEGLNMDDFEETEDYEPTDPDGFDQQIIDIFGCNSAPP
jgi:hypothetical protein